MARKINEISDFLNKVKFKKKLFGGIDETDVWNIIKKLNAEYKELYDVQQAQIDFLKDNLNEK